MCTIFHVEFPLCVWAGKHQVTWVMHGPNCETSVRNNQEESTPAQSQHKYVMAWGVGVPNKDTDLRVTRRGLSLENDGHVCLCPVYHFMWFLHEIHEIKSTAIVRRCWDQEILFWTFIERNLRAEPRTKTQHKQGAYTKNADILIRIIYIILKIVDFQHTNLQLHHSIS